MHLLVLSAFRRFLESATKMAPFCVSMHLLVLSAFRLTIPEDRFDLAGVSMHLLVLSAFRLDTQMFVRETILSQCTFWCSVLSDWLTWIGCVIIFMSQCTFWCSVLSDLDIDTAPVPLLNVSMHLLVLSAFRQGVVDLALLLGQSQCTFWCSVLSDPARRTRYESREESQCTFWCSVLSDSAGDI